MQAVSDGRAHLLPLFNIREMQQASGPPGRLEHFDPLHMPQLAAQQTPVAFEAGLCGSSSNVADMPAVQKCAACFGRGAAAVAAETTASAVVIIAQGMLEYSTAPRRGGWLGAESKRDGAKLAASVLELRKTKHACTKEV